MQNTMISLVVVIVVLVGQFPLQYFLSTRENKWLGYILPVIDLLLMGPMPGGIFCVIHALIYRVSRDRVRRRMADWVDKMNIQDLE